MNRAILKRLENLEHKAAPKDTGKVHTFIVSSEEEAEEKTQALKASPEWNEGDDLFIIQLVAAVDGRPA